MSYQIPDNASLERMMDYTTGVVASLSAMPETAALVKPWQPVAEKLRAERDARDTTRAAQLAAAAKVRVCDARWDAVVTELSGRAYLAGGKDAMKEPYVSLFGSVRAADATALGPYKATVFGRKLLARLGELGHTDLKDMTAALASINTELERAATGRTEMAEKAAAHEVRRHKLVEEIEALVAQTEVGVLTALPGKSTISRTMLSWNSHVSRSTRTRVMTETSAQATEGGPTV
ncbi:MAG: hypothetical protein AAB426_11510 [Myxococcota bacterium]